jgi:hypothetical protein
MRAVAVVIQNGAIVVARPSSILWDSLVPPRKILVNPEQIERLISGISQGVLRFRRKIDRIEAT